jgi:hypothetical protein
MRFIILVGFSVNEEIVPEGFYSETVEFEMGITFLGISTGVE